MALIINRNYTAYKPENHRAKINHNTRNKTIEEKNPTKYSSTYDWRSEIGKVCRPQ